MPSYPRKFALWTMVLVALETSEAATTVLAEGYTLRVWQTQDGLPQNMVTSAAQTRDGYLWFGTNSGLARFDGERFQVFNSSNTPEVQDRRVARLFEDANGDLWIGHEAGAITRYSKGRFERFSVASGSENQRIIGLGSDEHGAMWAMRENGAVDSLDQGHRLPTLIPAERPGIMGWSRGSPGNIWVAENGTAAQLLNGQLVPANFPPAVGSNYVFGVAGAADGGAWILCDDRIRKWKDNRWSEDRGPYPWPPGGISAAVELRDGTLAVGTIHAGLYLVFTDGRPAVHFDRRNGMPQDWVRFLYEDLEGTLWVGASAGLVSVRSSPFSVLNASERWDGRSVLSVAAGRGGSLWVGTDGAGLFHLSAGRMTHFGEAAGLGNTYISSVIETPGGEVWAGNYWWGGPYLLEQGRFVRPASVDARWSPALALLPLPETGELLVGNRDGLLRLSRERSMWLIRSPQGSADDACAVARDRDGTIWCGFSQGGLARLIGGELTIFGHKDGLGSNSIQCLFADDDGALWIGTADGGLIRHKGGRFSQIDMTRGLADTVICNILDDGLGYFWLSTHHGIQRVAKTELNRCADGAIDVFASQIYDRNDGLPIIEFLGGRQGSACRTDDGRLWFASSIGLISVDPARIRSNPTPPPVVVESLVADGRPVATLNGSVPAHLPPDHERLEFHFSGLSFAAPSKVLFKYQLEGIDNTWIESGAKRAASYSRLPAGSYRFRVIACNNDGLWNLTPATLTFTIDPFFWETWWFVGSCILATITAVAFLVRYITRRRMQQRIEQIERQHEIERERARIAQDIHDDVGASLSRIAMLSQPAQRDLAEPERTAAMLSRIYTTAREVTRSLDEIVWAVDPRHDTLDSLVDYMGRYAQGFLAAANVRCRLDLPVEVPTWPLTAETRHNLFLAFKEALNNAVKHAGASEARISFSLHPDSFVLVVKDNGHGFDPAEAPSKDSARISGGNGLINMKKRLARIGGRCEITSTVGGGTSVELIVNFVAQDFVPPLSPQSQPTSIP